MVATLEDTDEMEAKNIEELEIVFGSAERWLSHKWSQALKSGSLQDVNFLVLDLFVY